MLKNWSFERSSGYAGYRNSVTGEWVHSDVHDKMIRLEELIENSSYIKNLEFSWDDDGAEVISKVTWDKSVDILESLFEKVRKEYGKFISLPDINPCVDGSIDLEFGGIKGYSLLININKEEVHYYGCFRTISLMKGKRSTKYSDEIKGKISENFIEEFYEWVSKNITN